MKPFALMIAALALAGCETPDVAADLAPIRAACAAGDTNACVYLDQRRLAKSAALIKAGQGLSTIGAPPQRTTCYRNAVGQLVCNTF